MWNRQERIRRETEDHVPHTDQLSGLEEIKRFVFHDYISYVCNDLKQRFMTALELQTTKQGIINTILEIEDPIL